MVFATGILEATGISATGASVTHDPPETTGVELDSDDELASAAELAVLGVSVLWVVCVGVAVCSVVAVSVSGVAAACVEVAACSDAISGSVAACVMVVAAALGACAGEARAFAALDLCVACARDASWREEEALPRAPVSFAEVLARVLPGKACAAIAVNAPVSVTLPASSQRLQRARRRRAASLERLEGEVVMHPYSTPLPFIR
jgi:hypothetical protein